MAWQTTTVIEEHAIDRMIERFSSKIDGYSSKNNPQKQAHNRWLARQLIHKAIQSGECRTSMSGKEFFKSDLGFVVATIRTNGKLIVKTVLYPYWWKKLHEYV